MICSPRGFDGEKAAEVTQVTAVKHGKAGAVRIASSGTPPDFQRVRFLLVFLVIAVVACGDGAGPARDSRGVLLVVRGSGKGSEIYAIRPDGSESRQVTHNAYLDDDPDWSPDGSRIVLVSAQDSTPGAPTRRPEIFVMSADGTDMRRLLVTTGPARHPRWSPDGTLIAFAAYDAGVQGYRLHVMKSDGSNVRLLTSSAIENFSPEWSPDGKQLLFLSNRPPRNWWTIYVIAPDGSGERQLAGNAACGTNVSGPRWSPDGARIAYACDDQFGGIFTIRADGTQPAPVSTGSADGFNTRDVGPVWSRDGRQLAFTRRPSGGAGPAGQLHSAVYIAGLSTGSVTRLTSELADETVHAWGPTR
jgi:Tol biopolymer transport system component